MKFNVKKYIYLLNDVSNLILKKDRIKDHENAQKLRKALIIVSILLLISIVINIILYIKYV